MQALVVRDRPVIAQAPPTCSLPHRKLRWKVNAGTGKSKPVKKPRSIPAVTRSGMYGSNGSIEVLRPSPNPSPAEQLARSLIWALDQADLPGRRLQQMGSYFVELPVRLGTNKALDSSVECYLHAHALILQGHAPQASGKELQLHGRAIATLREGIVEPGAQNSTETLAAALMLAQYEFLKRSRENAVIEMAGGVAAIFQAWGPARIVSDFEVQLFATQVPAIITHALQLGTSCFLDDPQWHAAMRKCKTHHPVMIKLWIALSTLPSLLVELRGLLSSPVGGNKEKLLHRACRLKEHVLTQEYIIRSELSSPAIAKIAPHLYTGASPPAPSNQAELCVARSSVQRAAMYWATIIFLNTVLERLGVTSSTLARQSAEAAISIISTLSVAASIKPLGAMFVTFCGPAAYGFLGWSQRQHIQKSISDIFQEINIDFSHTVLQRMFDAFTGAPAR